MWRFREGLWVTAVVCPAAALAFPFGALLAPGCVSLHLGVRDFFLESFIASFVSAWSVTFLVSSPVKTSVPLFSYSCWGSLRFWNVYF